jgi:hypothetical protein
MLMKKVEKQGWRATHEVEPQPPGHVPDVPLASVSLPDHAGGGR